jgi:serine kinase of HPr protein (carbohydrate metabolism regulator)
MTDEISGTTGADIIHATSVAIDGRVILLMGASGSGKSDLGLRLIDRGATLVSDDYTVLVLRGGQLFASPPTSIAGRIEVRHVGIVTMANLHNVPVALAIRLDDKPDRMPDRTLHIPIMGVEIPILCLDAREASAPIKAELALRTLVG